LLLLSKVVIDTGEIFVMVLLFLFDFKECGFESGKIMFATFSVRYVKYPWITEVISLVLLSAFRNLDNVKFCKVNAMKAYGGVDV
jgi:hypothetical protein